MGVFDKLKNIFFEEEYVEVEEPIKPRRKEKPVKEKPVKEKPTIAKKVELNEMPKINEEKSAREREIEEEVIDRVEKKSTVISEPEKKDNSFKFPMSFEDEDFEVDSYSRPKREEKEETPKKNNYYSESYSNNSNQSYGGFGGYGSKKEEYKNDYKEYTSSGVYEAGDYRKEQKVFRPTPIISPIYGILDKNYKKEEIVTKKEVRLTSASSKKVDLDSIREKAYGDLASDITASMTDEEEPKVEKKTRREEKVEVEPEDSLYDLTDNDHPVVSNVTMGDAEEYFNDLGLEYNVDYKDNNKGKDKVTGRRSNKNKMESSDDSLFDLIDSMYKNEEGD